MATAPKRSGLSRRIAGLNRPRNRESLSSPARLKIALDFDACKTQKSNEAGDASTSGRVPPKGQEDPKRSGEFPRQVRVKPPASQVKPPNWSGSPA